jgi:hypothetical protein
MIPTALETKLMSEGSVESGMATGFERGADKRLPEGS